MKKKNMNYSSFFTFYFSHLIGFCITVTVLQIDDKRQTGMLFNFRCGQHFNTFHLYHSRLWYFCIALGLTPGIKSRFWVTQNL